MPSGNGFRPVLTLSGGHKFRSRSYLVGPHNPHDLFIGHAVALTSGNVVGATTSTNGPLLGVIKATYTSTRNRPRTHDANGLYIPSSTAAYVDVYDDPNIVYSVVVNATASAAMIGGLVDVVAAATGKPKTGISTMSVDAASFAAETSANAVNVPFKIIGLSDTERYAYSSGQRVDVIINNHLFKLAVI